jgi:hypothetical protein
LPDIPDQYVVVDNDCTNHCHLVDHVDLVHRVGLASHRDLCHRVHLVDLVDRIRRLFRLDLVVLGVPVVLVDLVVRVVLVARHSILCPVHRLVPCHLAGLVDLEDQLGHLGLDCLDGHRLLDYQHHLVALANLSSLGFLAVLADLVGISDTVASVVQMARGHHHVLELLGYQHGLVHPVGHLVLVGLVDPGCLLDIGSNFHHLVSVLVVSVAHCNLLDVLHVLCLFLVLR